MGYRNFSGVDLPETNQSGGVNYIRGGAGDETLNGTARADEFEGGGGWDTYVGGAGDDFYWLRDGRHPVIERPGEGIDTIKVWPSAALPANVENLIVFGDNQYAVGNELNNIIKGEDGAQYLYGGYGEDVLIGGGGSDTFVVRRGEGNEVIQDFQPGADKVRLLGGGNLYTFDAVKAAMTQQGSDVVLNNGGTMILFRNMTVGQFSERDFQLPLNYGNLGSQTFVDDFNSLQTGSVWQTNFGYGGTGVVTSYTLPRNGEQQLYVDSSFAGTSSQPLGLNPFSVNNGVLTITATQVSDAQSNSMWGYDYASGMLMSKFSQTYGYFEVRAELPQGQGFWPAFWLIGQDNSEIDVLEQIGTQPREPATAVHSNGAGHQGGNNFQPDIGGFHTYGTLWSPTETKFYIDGTEVWKTATPADINRPMQMIVNLAVGGNWPGSPDSSTPWPGQLKIDYVKVWNLPGQGQAPSSPPPPPPVVVSPPPPPPAPVSPPPAADGGQVLTGSGANLVLTGGAGADTIYASQGYDVLTGGDGADRFVFQKEPWAPDTIKDFQLGKDVLDFKALFSAAGYTGSDPVADKYIRFESDGIGGTKVLFDRDGAGAAQPYANYIAYLQGVPTAGLTWGQLSGASAPVSPPPPASPPPPPPVSGAAGQVLSGAGTNLVLTGGAGADTIYASQGFDVLTGGDGADRFVFQKEPWAPDTIKDFQLGKDVLDFSALFKAAGYTGSDPIADKYIRFESDGIGGTKVLFDRDGAGSGQPYANYIAYLEKVPTSGLTWGQLSGGSTVTAQTTPQPSTAAGVVLTATGANAVLTGGAGADTINASQGYDVLTGGGGADRFVFGKEPWAPDTIKDFVHGQDQIDLRALFDANGYTGNDPFGAGYLRLQSDGLGGTQVLFDRDAAGTGQPWPNYIIHIEGVAPSTFTASDWIFQ